MFKCPDGDTTLGELAQSLEDFNAEMMCFQISQNRIGGLTFTVAVGFEESAKYLSECVSEHNNTEEFELDGSDY